MIEEVFAINEGLHQLLDLIIYNFQIATLAQFTIKDSATDF